MREIEASDLVALIESAGHTWGESSMQLITTKCLFTNACGKRLINANLCHGIMLSALLGERPFLHVSAASACCSRGRSCSCFWPPPCADATRWPSASCWRQRCAAPSPIKPSGRTWTWTARSGTSRRARPARRWTSRWRSAMADWFRELHTLAGSSAYVLPAHSRSRAARHGGDTHVNEDTLREAIDHWLHTATPGVRRFTPHDLRCTVKSHLCALGVPRDISEI